MYDAMPTTTPTTDTRDMGAHKRLEAIAGSVQVVRSLEALCKGTGVECAVKANPNNKGDWIISLRY